MGALKTAVKVFGVFTLLLLIAISAVGFMAVSDAREFSRRLPSEPNAFLLADEGEVLAGARNLMHEESPSPMKAEAVESYENYISQNDYESMVGDNYRVFVVSFDTFNSLDNNTKIGDAGATITVKKAKTLLKAESSRKKLIEDALSSKAVPEGYEEQARKMAEDRIPSESELRSSLFLLLLSAYADLEGPSFIISGYREGSIEVYPKTMLFRVLKIIPEPAINAVEAGMSGEGA